MRTVEQTLRHSISFSRRARSHVTPQPANTGLTSTNSRLVRTPSARRFSPFRAMETTPASAHSRISTAPSRTASEGSGTSNRSLNPCGRNFRTGSLTISQRPSELQTRSKRRGPRFAPRPPIRSAPLKIHYPAQLHSAVTRPLQFMSGRHRFVISPHASYLCIRPWQSPDHRFSPDSARLARHCATPDQRQEKRGGHGPQRRIASVVYREPRNPQRDLLSRSRQRLHARRWIAGHVVRWILRGRETRLPAGAGFLYVDVFGFYRHIYLASCILLIRY